MKLSELLLGLGKDMKQAANQDREREQMIEEMCSLPEYKEREKQLERIVEDLTDTQLFAFALYEIHKITECASEAVSAELLRRSGVSESLAQW